jgi:isoamylase
MLLDELRRTQCGNNNTYCQDNDTSWYDWRYLERRKAIFRFTCGLVAFRRTHTQF